MYRKICISLLAAAIAGPAVAAASSGEMQGQATTPAAAPAAEAAKPMTRAQFLANVQARFNAVDTNHDGYLEESEVAAAQQKELQELQQREQQRLEAEFNRLDTNHDGQLSKAEFMAAAPPIKARETPAQLVGTIDANKDHKVSLQEYEAGPLSTFNKLDANHDGTVTPQEIEAARKGAAARPARRKR